MATKINFDTLDVDKVFDDLDTKHPFARSIVRTKEGAMKHVVKAVMNIDAKDVRIQHTCIAIDVTGAMDRDDLVTILATPIVSGGQLFWFGDMDTYFVSGENTHAVLYFYPEENV